MPQVDFSAAYRDAARGSTIKALQKRRDEMQAATASDRQPVAGRGADCRHCQRSGPRRSRGTGGGFGA